MDHLCDSLNFVAFGTNQWLHDGRSRSYPAGHRHRRHPDPGFSESKTTVALGNLTVRGKSFGKEVAAGPEKIEPNLMNPSVRKYFLINKLTTKL